MSEEENSTERDLGVQPLDAILTSWGLENHDLVDISPEQITHKQVQKARTGRRLTLKMMMKMTRTLNYSIWGRLSDEEREDYDEYFHKHLCSYFLQLSFKALRGDREALVTISRVFADRFRSARLRHGLSRMELAQKLGVKYQTVLSWEYGQNTPVPKMFGKVVSVLGDDVLADEDNIGDQLKVERLRRGWTAYETAEHFSVGRRRWSDYENSKSEVESTLLGQIAKAFGWKENQYV